MGKRCLEGCPYLAQDETCLLKVEDMPEKCPKRETINHEDKDEWMLKRHYLKKPEKNVRY